MSDLWSTKEHFKILENELSRQEASCPDPATPPTKSSRRWGSLAASLLLIILWASSMYLMYCEGYRAAEDHYCFPGCESVQSGCQDAVTDGRCRTKDYFKCLSEIELKQNTLLKEIKQGEKR